MPNNFELDKIIGFFEADVLNLYESHPDKYELDTDFFEGVLETTETYQPESSGRLDEYIRIRFGYHSKRDGTLCIAVFLPDFTKAPKIEQRKWSPFIVEKSLLSQEDKRFEMWYDRYIRGSFEVPIAPRKRLSHIIEKINACCKTLVAEPLYTKVPDKSVRYPISQNSHAYEDAHRNLYGFLVDSLSKKCLLALAGIRNQTIPEAQNMRSTTLLRHVFNELDEHSKLHALLSRISKQRGKSSHDVRPAAIEYDAFGNFYRDIEGTTEAYEELLKLIESEFNASSDRELRRHEAINYLPQIVGDVESHYSICEVTRMVGKTVEKVEFGMREDIEGVHQSEVLRVKFTDDEILAMDTKSNASDLEFNAAMQPNEFQVNFMLRWVPASPDRRREIMASLPQTVGGIESHYSICEATRMVGKTVEKVEFGMREDIEGIHQSEALCVKFTNGEILGVETGSNASDLEFNAAMQPNELQVNFMLRWVCAPSNR